MKNEIEEMQGYLRKIGAFLSKVKFRLHELEVEGTVNEGLDRFFDHFSPAPLRSNVASQPNKQNNQFWTVKELKDMPFLKDLKYRQLKNGTHQFRYRRDGFDVSFNSKNLKTAKEKAQAFILDLKKKMGADVSIKHVNTLDYVAQLWFGNKKHHVAAHTLRVYQSVYDNHVKPTFGSRKIKDILPMDLQPFFNALAGTLGKTCENAKIILNGIFDFAVANRLCITSPMPGVIIERHVRKVGKALNDEQIKRFKNVMHAAGGFGTAYLIILFSGIRGAELERMSFDWNAGTFTVYNAKLKKHQRAREENLTRTVPIFPGLFALRSRIEREDWRYGAKAISDNIKRFWSESTVKDLRHTFTTKARECGIDNELVNLWTGHLPGKNVTANVYTHFSLEFQQRQAQKINI